MLERERGREREGRGEGGCVIPQYVYMHSAACMTMLQLISINCWPRMRTHIWCESVNYVMTITIIVIEWRCSYDTLWRILELWLIVRCAFYGQFSIQHNERAQNWHQFCIFPSNTCLPLLSSPLSTCPSPGLSVSLPPPTSLFLLLLNA